MATWTYFKQWLISSHTIDRSECIIDLRKTFVEIYRTDCPEPPKTPTSLVNMRHDAFGVVATYTCIKGFAFADASTIRSIICRNGKWPIQNVDICPGRKYTNDNVHCVRFWIRTWQALWPVCYVSVRIVFVSGHPFCLIQTRVTERSWVNAVCWPRNCSLLPRIWGGECGIPEFPLDMN